jgi:hypothetical protein
LRCNASGLRAGEPDPRRTGALVDFGLIRTDYRVSGQAAFILEPTLNDRSS